MRDTEKKRETDRQRRVMSEREKEKSNRDTERKRETDRQRRVMSEPQPLIFF